MTTKESNDISLQVLENYKDHLDVDKREILIQFLNVLSSYLENLKTTKITSSFNIIRGIDTIYHVYIIVLSRTKNLKTAVLNAHKALYLYTEFSEQISEESNMVLQLSSREASLYVYKKTLYELLPSNSAPLDHVVHHLLFIKIAIEYSFIQKMNIDYVKQALTKFIKTNTSVGNTKIMLDMINENNFIEIMETKKLLKKEP